MMARGTRATVGQTMTSKNGYHYTRCENGWVLTHRLVAEKKLGRPLAENERVTFDDGDRTNLHPNNIIITTKNTASIRKQIARHKAKIKELQAQVAILERQLKASSKLAS